MSLAVSQCHESQAHFSTHQKLLLQHKPPQDIQSSFLDRRRLPSLLMKEKRFMFRIFGKNIGYGLLLAYLFGGPAIFKKFVGYIGHVAAARSSRNLRQLNSKIHTDRVEASRIDWKPISLFPEEAKRFRDRN